MTTLRRRLGTADAVVVGLSAMIGAGVFSVFGPAADAAGSGLLFALVIAGFVAYCNAMSSAELAARYPSSGGTYVYGRERLGPWAGFTAGWSFVIGKTASCAAMALTFAHYVAPSSARPLAVGAVIVFAAVNYFGVTKTAGVARVLLAVTVVTLGVVLAGVYTQPLSLRQVGAVEADGVLQAAGLLFFAFAGYARIATLGEEVRDPRRTLPRAIPLALGSVLVLYALVGVGLLLTLGPQRLATSSAPLTDAAGALAPVATVAAAVASLGALLALLAGVGRTTLAMARNADLPTALAAVHPRYGVPHRAELVLAAVLIAVVLSFDVRDAIGFSSFGVLLYYAVANASALTLRIGKLSAVRAGVGLVGCLLLAVTLPWASVVAGLGVLAVGLLGRLVHQHLS